MKDCHIGRQKFNRIACGHKLVVELSRSISALVVRCNIEVAPQPRIGRHGDQERSSGGQQLADLSQNSDVVLEVLEDIKEPNDLESDRKRWTTGVRAHQERRIHASLRVPQAFLMKIHAYD